MIEQYLTKKYGSNVRSRITKLAEEVGELCGANTEEEIFDELADCQMVLYHLARLKGWTIEDLIMYAMHKIEEREKNPEYLRTHPHVERCCGNCAHFLNEDTIGWGNCRAENDKITTCSDNCPKWQFILK